MSLWIEVYLEERDLPAAFGAYERLIEAAASFAQDDRHYVIYSAERLFSDTILARNLHRFQIIDPLSIEIRNVSRLLQRALRVGYAGENYGKLIARKRNHVSTHAGHAG